MTLAPKSSHGGPRPNSGRKPDSKNKRTIQQMEVAKTLPVADTPLDFLLTVMRDPNFDLPARLDAAKTAAQYCHLKKGDGGIKDEKAEKSKKASTASSRPAPRRSSWFDAYVRYRTEQINLRVYLWDVATSKPSCNPPLQAAAMRNFGPA